MFRKILLLICVAFVVVCYGYPCFLLPFGNYEYKQEVAGAEITSSYSFAFNGKFTHKVGDIETEGFYKLKGNNIILSEDETFDDNDVQIKLTSMYEFNNHINKIGIYSTIGIGILSLILIVTIPKRL